VITPQEHELLKCVPENEVILQILGNVKVAAPGGQKLWQEKKKDKEADMNNNSAVE